MWMINIFIIYCVLTISNVKTNTISCTNANCNNILFMHIVLPEYFDLPRPSSGEIYVTRRNGMV